MTDQRDQAEAIFKDTVELDAAARDDLLKEACGDDTALRAVVESLLAADAAGSGFLETPVWPASDAAFGAADPTMAGTDRAGRPVRQIGPYRIVREIDHGGMGVVYVGVRDDDRFHRTAAVKVLKRGMDTEDVLRRFELERQVLSALNHPHIARLLDGGLTADGRPFFAMEYIEGEPIDEHCDSHRLTTTERLQLFAKVCAVHHAHQNLVVHRDLKPGNILVSRDGDPKLLDFGIAKLLNRDMAGGIAAQPTGNVNLMTPQYASPEQVSGKPITTASDIYSLGVVMYELLTGHKPYHMGAYASAEFVRVICEEDREKPSTAVATTERLDATRSITPEAVSRHRDTRVDRLRRGLKGDIDNIVLKAMAKAPQRRYQSCEELAADIERHLKGFPVTARPDSVHYRAVKFVRRNRAGVAVAALVAVASVASLTAVVEHLRGQAAAAEVDAAKARADASQVRADLEQARARSAQEDAEQLVLMIQEISDVVSTLDTSLRVLPGALQSRRELVDMALGILVRLEQYSEVREVRPHLATGYSRVGSIRFSKNAPHLGDLDGAIELQEKALRIREELHETYPNDVDIAGELADSHNLVGDLLRTTSGMEAEALAEYDRALEILAAIGAEDAPDSDLRYDWAATLVNIGDMLRKAGRTDEALEHYERSVKCREENVRLWPTAKARRNLAVGYGRLASVLEDRRQYEDGAAWRRLGLESRLQLLEQDPDNGSFLRDTWIARCALARVLLRPRADDPEQALDAPEALRLLQEGQPVIESLLQAEPADARLRVDVAYQYACLARAHLTLEDREAAALAISRFEGAIQSLEALNEDHPDLPKLRRELGILARTMGMY